MESTRSTEKQLFGRALTGDQMALQELLLIRYDWLTSHLHSQVPGDLRGAINIEDIVQETYVRAFRKIHSVELKDKEGLLAWLRKIARNALIDTIRRAENKRRAPATIIGSQGEIRAAGKLLEECLPALDPHASSVARQQELHHAFRIALAALPSKQRQVIELLYIQGLTQEEAARVVGTTTAAVHGLSHRAKKKLRETLVRLSLYI